MLRLDDDRQLGWCAQGAPGGDPVIYIHGAPGSRHDILLPRHGPASTLRLITPDRPGYGDSSPHPGHDSTDLANDIARLADHLGIERFALLGFSAGGVFALACAAALGDRVERVTLIGTPAIAFMEDPFAAAGSMTADSWRLAAGDPARLAEQLHGVASSGQALADTLSGAMGPADRHLLTGAVADRFLLSMTTAVCQGPANAAAAIAHDLHRIMGPWGFDPATVHQPVDVFHGEDDTFIHPLHGRVLAATLPQGRFVPILDCGHFGGIFDHREPAPLAGFAR